MMAFAENIAVRMFMYNILWFSLYLCDQWYSWKSLINHIANNVMAVDIQKLASAEYTIYGKGKK